MPNIGPSPCVESLSHSKQKIVHVAVAVIERSSPSRNTFLSNSPSTLTTPREILIAKRPEHVHQGGFWEFPGGKVEVGETVKEALARELLEELGIIALPDDMTPLIKITHDYGDKHVLLDVYTVHDFEGEVEGKEGQPIQWVNENNLLNFTFPDANQAILSACRLPSYYFITPEYESLESALVGIQEQLDNGIHFFLFRQPKLSLETYEFWVRSIIETLPRTHGKMLLSEHYELLDRFSEGGVAGVHLPFKRAFTLRKRPIHHSKWLGVSCHNLEEIRHAEELGADFITVSPVLFTATHPEATPLGWDTFGELVQQAKVPVYALGGMWEEHNQSAVALGAQGVAGIRMFLPK